MKNEGFVDDGDVSKYPTTNEKYTGIAITKCYLGLKQEEILETYDYLTF